MDTVDQRNKGGRGRYYLVGLAGLLVLAGGLAIRYKTAPTVDLSKYPLIVPGKSIGPVRLGMTEAEVVGAMGKPSRAEQTRWVYKQAAIAMLFTKSPDAKVTFIDAGEVGVSEKQAMQFPCRTAEGIGMGSMAAQVIVAYGQPDSNSQAALPANLSRMNYRKRGISFMLVNNRVHWIGVQAPADQQ